MSTKDAEYVLRVAMDSINFDPQDQRSDELASLIEQEILSRKMSISPGRAALRRSAHSAINGEKLSATASAAISEVDKSTYTAFITPILSHRLNEATDIDRLLEILPTAVDNLRRLSPAYSKAHK